MTIKWFKSPFKCVIFPLTQPQVANKKNVVFCSVLEKTFSTVFRIFWILWILAIHLRKLFHSLQKTVEHVFRQFSLGAKQAFVFDPAFRSSNSSYV